MFRSSQHGDLCPCSLNVIKLQACWVLWIMYDAAVDAHWSMSWTLKIQVFGGKTGQIQKSEKKYFTVILHYSTINIQNKAGGKLLQLYNNL